MQQYSSFIFDSYDLNEGAGSIHLRYSLDDAIHFEETILLPKDRPLTRKQHPDLDRALFLLHLMGGASYYKTCCPKTIEVRNGALSDEQAAFWDAVYEKGLGEFFYKNTIDYRGLICFPRGATPEQPEARRHPREGKRKALVPLGGGKDSLVTAELLRTHTDVTLFRVGKHPFIGNLVSEMHLPILTVERHLSKELFVLNSQGALNGHVPISGYMNSLTTVLALLYGFDTVVMSNERSANEGNVEYLGTEINHQWSKSLEFEQAFAGYLAKHVTHAIEHFSLLRPLSELSIAKIFANLGRYRCSFTSCNANWKILGEKPKERWCGHCPKCLFSMILLSAFIPKGELITIFGRNLLDDASLAALFRELLGIEGTKPFECVGTPEETIAALGLAYRRGDLDDSVLMQMFLSDVLPKLKDIDVMISRTLALSPEHTVPSDLLPLVTDADQ